MERLIEEDTDWFSRTKAVDSRGKYLHRLELKKGNKAKEMKLLLEPRSQNKGRGGVIA